MASRDPWWSSRENFLILSKVDPTGTSVIKFMYIIYKLQENNLSWKTGYKNLFVNQQKSEINWKSVKSASFFFPVCSFFYFKRNFRNQGCAFIWHSAKEVLAPCLLSQTRIAGMKSHPFFNWSSRGAQPSYSCCFFPILLSSHHYPPP